MNPILLIGLLLAGPLRSTFVNTTDPNRFAVVIHGKYGFIDTSGKVVIPAHFEAVQEFSEGLCAVRLHGQYGFIDTRGEWVIPARYDYATVFHEDLALVFLQGKPMFITKNGKLAFKSDYKTMTPFRNGRSYVQTYTDKVGIIDKTGWLLVDTVYRHIGAFRDGRAVAIGLEHRTFDDEDKKRNLEVTIIDEKGTRLVPYGRFEEIEAYSEGYAVARWGSKGHSTARSGLLDREGNVVYTLPKNENSWIQSGVHSGVVRVHLPVNKKGKNTSEDYDAYITPQGKPVYDNPLVEFGEDFQDNHAFFHNKSGGMSIVNRRGEVIAHNWILEVLENGFQNGKACVRTSNGWGIMDTTGHCILSPRFKNIYSGGLVDDLILFEDTVLSEDEYPRYGISDLRGNILVKPLFQYFDLTGFKNGLIKTIVGDCLTYIDRSGKIVWQEESVISVVPGPLNIDYMNRGYFYAGYENTGHGAPTRTKALAITSEFAFPGEALSVVVDCTQPVTINEKIKGFNVYVANATADTLRFNAQDSRLYMNMQALDTMGTWRNIEYLPNSWCGNSYHTVELADRHYWTFHAPVYTGNFYTKLRVKLVYVDPTDKPASDERRRGSLDWAYRDKRQLTIYSNEFEGSVNAAQFWRRPDYSPSGLMDPYNE